MDTQSSQKRSPRSSVKSERSHAGMGQQEQPHRGGADIDHEEYMDRSFDHVARVRAAKEAAQRESAALVKARDPSRSYKRQSVCLR